MDLLVMIRIGIISGLSSRNIQQQRRYSTLRKVNLNPSFVSGFIDAEGCFSLRGQSPRWNKERKAGWAVKLSFQITLHQKDKALLVRSTN